MEQDRKYDSVVSAIILAFQKRAEFGEKKYGTNLDRTDLSFLDWVQHAQEELMDGILYLEKMKQGLVAVRQTSHAAHDAQDVVVDGVHAHAPRSVR
jgi:hypothetical protein